MVYTYTSREDYNAIINNFKNVTKVDDGLLVCENIYSETKGGEVQVYYYVPDSYLEDNSNTPKDASFYLYMHANENMKKLENAKTSLPMVNYLNDNMADNPSQVLTILPGYCASDIWDSEKNAYIENDIVNYLAQKYNLNIKRGTFAGFSKTADEAVWAQAIYNKETSYIDENTQELVIPANVVVLSDGTFHGAPDVKMVEKYGEYLNNTVAFICGEGDKSVYKINANGDNYASLFKYSIKISNDYYYTNGNSHPVINTIPVLDGISDFALGVRDLNNIDNYTFEIYNVETGEYEEIGYEEVKALVPGLTDEDIIEMYKQSYTDDTVLKFDSEFLESNVGIIEEKKTNLESVANGLKEEGYASTTLSPKVENDIINTIKSKITSSVEEINALIQESKSIGESKDDLEQKELELVEMLDVGDTSFMDEYKG